MRFREISKKCCRLEKTFGRQQAGSLLGKFFQAYRIKRYEGKTFFEKKVLPLKLPFPKNFNKERFVTCDERIAIIPNSAFRIPH